MTHTAAVCPICGCLVPSNGTSVTVAVGQDVVVTASGVIASASGTSLIVGTGATFPVGTYVRVRSERMLVTAVNSNTLTVTRNAKKDGAIATIAIGDSVTTGYDTVGNAGHCPVCGSAQILVDHDVVATKTGVIVASQHPIDYDAVYVTGVVDGNNTQQGTAYTGTVTVVPHAFATTGGKVLIGTQVVDINTSSAQVALDASTPETINSTVGP